MRFRLLEWLAFNVVTLNADGHAKTWRSSTRKTVPGWRPSMTWSARKLAMNVGGQDDPAPPVARIGKRSPGAWGWGAASCSKRSA